MKLETKHIVIIAVILVVVYFFISKKGNTTTSTTTEKSKEDLLAEASANSAAAYNEAIGTTVSAAHQTAEDEEYNLKRQEYFQVTGQTASRTLTFDQLQKGIDDFKEKQKLLRTYIEISNDQDTSQEAAMGVEELKNAITQAKQKQEKEKKDAELKAKKTAWNAKKTNVQALVSKFRNNISNNGNYSSAKKYPWDASLLDQFKALSDQELAHAEQYFASSGGITVSNNYGGSANKRTSLATALPTGNRLTRRPNSNKMTALKKHFESKGSVMSKAVNEYGEWA